MRKLIPLAIVLGWAGQSLGLGQQVVVPRPANPPALRGDAGSIVDERDVARRRRTEFCARHPELSARVRSMILHGTYAIGFTMEQVVAAIGRPQGSEQRSNQAPGRILWAYRGGAVNLYFEDGVLRVIEYPQ